MIDTAPLWTVIIGLGIGSFALRFVFLGLVGDRPLPPWLLRHLRYTAVAILPALIAPLVVWPSATGNSFEPVRFTAGLLTLAVAFYTKNVLSAMLVGAATLGVGLYFWG
ncbi:AzlD domain-containing protein [Roseivivax sp. CAU 1753]